MKRAWVVLAVVGLIGLAAFGAPKIGFLYSGPVGDYGWTYAHDQARQALPYDTTYVEDVTPDSIAATVEMLVGDGCSMIFCTSWEQLDVVQEIAPDYPSVSFFCARIEGEPSENVWLFLGRMYEARYWAGVSAAKVSESGKIGYVAAFPIPEVIRGINAFTVGAQTINPDIEVIVRWTFSWFDPGAEVEAAQSLISDECDVLSQHVQGPSVQQVAEEEGAYSIGYNVDMSEYAPTANVDNCIWNWEPIYRWLIFEALNGASGSLVWASAATGTVGVTSGEITPPDLGWSDAELMSMDGFVDGVSAP